MTNLALLRSASTRRRASSRLPSALICLAFGLSAGCQPPTPPMAQPAPAATPDEKVPEANAPATTTPAEATPATSTSQPAASKNANPSAAPAMKTVTHKSFGKTADGQETTLYTCSNGKGLTVSMTDYGATLVTVETPDRDGKPGNINLGFESVGDYEQHTAYFGCVAGRFANRIAHGKFTLDGQEYKLATNNGPHHLHGGNEGFNRKVWKAEPIEEASQVGVRFRYNSPDGEEGYPGTLKTVVTYLITDDNRLIMDFKAETDKPTVLNLINHAYWNLAGAGSGTILEQELMLAADKYIEVDETLIPTGKMPEVAGTPMDFTKPMTIGSRIEELTNDPRGYDHCYVLRDRAKEPTLAARARDPKSGRVMEVLTTQPGVQLYTSNFLDGGEVNGGHPKHAAFCLETQHLPDSPNRPDYPSTVLRPGEKFHQVTIHKFSAE